MKTLFIGYPKCSTCQKAYKALEELGIHAEYRNIKEENPTYEELKTWYEKRFSHGLIRVLRFPNFLIPVACCIEN